MKIAILLSLLGLFDLVIAIPKRRIMNLAPRQATSVVSSCPPDSTVFVTSTFTATSGVTSTIQGATTAGTITATAASTDGTTVTTTLTISRTITGATPYTSTVAPNTITKTTTSTITSTVSLSSTVTTCIISAYKRDVPDSLKKRQTTTNTASDPTSLFTTTMSNTAAGYTTPASCVCVLVSQSRTLAPNSDFATRSSSISTTSCVQKTVTATTTITTISTNHDSTTILSTVYATVTSTPVGTATVTVTQTNTFTSSITVTSRANTVTVQNNPTITVTTTHTPTYVSCPTPTATCNNQGVRWAAYNNTDSAGKNNTNTDYQYSSFDPTLFKTRKPVYSNTTYTLGGFTYPVAGIIKIYNSTVNFRSDYLAIDHVGYLFAQVTGTYTFSFSKTDDIVMLWVGPNAYSGWTKANANAISTYKNMNVNYSVSLTAGKYYPIRIFFGNAQEAMVFQATLTAPDGRVILTSNSGPSPYLVQYSCDNKDAPQFPAFGSET